jgi:hypothetical protein
MDTGASGPTGRRPDAGHARDRDRLAPAVRRSNHAARPPPARRCHRTASVAASLVAVGPPARTSATVAGAMAERRLRTPTM